MLNAQTADMPGGASATYSALMSNMPESYSKALAGMASTMTGSITNAYAKMSAAKANAELMRMDAGSFREAAKSTRAASRFEEDRSRRNTAKVQGAAKAAIAANGFATDSGSAVDAAADIAQMGELDALVIRHNYESQAIELENQARSSEIMAEYTRRQGKIDTFMTLADGASMVAGQWYQYSG
ncbi:MAG: hypothetical protein N0E44_18950 [Candidatus Thiodiazotropha lotti]|nr:hypothetical protein [Candidatus Thiodiazotropha lotti]MCW4221964.1 hypothetical protein [Candidatus Thiodiazotropha lotti]